MGKGALRLIRQPANGSGRQPATLVVVREGVGQVGIRCLRHVYQGPHEPGRSLLHRLRVEPAHGLRELGRFHAAPYRMTGLGLDDLVFPAGWDISHEVRDVDLGRLRRVADKAPGAYSARGRAILGWSPLATRKVPR